MVVDAIAGVSEHERGVAHPGDELVREAEVDRARRIEACLLLVGEVDLERAEVVA
jgi:hypothetical protein